jgi:hypothetical protein
VGGGFVHLSADSVLRTSETQVALDGSSGAQSVGWMRCAVVPPGQVLSQIFTRPQPIASLPAGAPVRRHVMIEFKGSYFERDVILWGIRWWVPYPISHRQVGEMMEERGPRG